MKHWKLLKITIPFSFENTFQYNGSQLFDDLRFEDLRFEYLTSRNSVQYLFFSLIDGSISDMIEDWFSLKEAE